MQKRNKAGGIIDRRFGENDPSMAPEDRMLERFTREKQKRVRGGEMFNLEEDEDVLTHFGKSLGGLRELGQGRLDDFEMAGMEEDTDETNPVRMARKRALDEDEDAEEGEDEEEKPERKKTKAEIMKEVVSKSKFHKYERQKMKEDDEDEREKLDAEMGALWSLLGARQPSTTGNTSGANNEPLGNGEAKPITSEETERKLEAEYDQAVREMMFDKRSQPADRTETEEEKAAKESDRLKKLEEARQRRMRGEENSDDEQPAAAAATAEPSRDGEFMEDERITDAAAYGFGEGATGAASQAVDDNPDAMLYGDYEHSDDGYVDVDEEGMIDGDEEFSDDDSMSGSEDDAEDSGDEDFLASVMPDKAEAETADSNTERSEKLAFTFPCPQTHKEMLEVVKGISVADTPIVIQRIRILHHSKLSEENKEKLQVCLKPTAILSSADGFRTSPVCSWNTLYTLPTSRHPRRPLP